MSQSPPNVTNAKTRPEVEYTQEVRFAVVMYGGSSLAIYMNGVAQELLRLVRATAPERPSAPGGVPRVAYLRDDELEGSERVYRKLGQLLARGEQPLSLDKVGEGKNAPLQTRFIIDILTGTSAGGINAVYLAKALVNDQRLDKLKKLWITEGDIGVLLNDSKSDKELGLGGQKPPGSLLNSRRMYLKLLKALRGMDEDRPVEAQHDSPLVDELDLFVTATDMNGRVLPLRLADGVAYERRHRNVFRFSYHPARIAGNYRNDFTHDYNPFLAFASRCTSAHQAAFEVMRFVDIEPALKKFPPPAGQPEHGVKSNDLQKFYEEYIRTADPERSVPFAERSFSDGGVLDNSPFSFASDALPFRHADAPVDRKLIYIEPSPEHPELDEESAGRPDFFQNVLMALSTLPRYQTIVEDLVRVLERNRLVERVNHILLGLEEDVKYRKSQGEHEEPPQLRDLLRSEEELRKWAKSKRGDLSWGGYQRLRVAEVTDDLTLLVANAVGFEEESDEFTAVRYLVTHWRDDNYDGGRELDSETEESRGPEKPKEPQVKFLLHFDLMWLVRRLKFVLTRINEISCFDARAWQVLDAASESFDAQVWPKGGKPLPQVRKEMREVLLGLKHGVAVAFTSLRMARQELWARGEANLFRPYVLALGIRSGDLIALLKEPTDEARRQLARRLLEQKLDEVLTQEDKNLLEGVGQSPGAADARLLGVLQRPGATRMDVIAALNEKVVEILRKQMDEARAKCAVALAPRESDADATDYEATFRRALWYYYRNFADYDQISHPILHATDVGEELDPVEVFRISPEDSTFLIDEKEMGVQKLAGTTLGHFGAFFEERFRHNDIMWGRLDAAERVIRALLPNEKHAALRAELTAEAHRAIIIEERVSRDPAAPQDKAALRHLVAEELKAGAGDDGRNLAAALATKLKGSGIDPSLKSFLHSFLDQADPLDKFRDDFFKNYEAERAFTPRDTVLNAGRASRIFGRMVDGIAAERRRGGGRIVLWLVRLTRWVWGLAEVAVPGSISNLFGLHLLRVLYFIEAALIALGVLFAWKEVQRVGLIALAITGGLHALILFVGDFILGGPVGGGRLWRWVKFLLRLGLVIAVVGGLAYLLFLTNKSWLPRLLDAIIKQLTEWNNELSGLKPPPR